MRTYSRCHLACSASCVTFPLYLAGLPLTRLLLADGAGSIIFFSFPKRRQMDESHGRCPVVRVRSISLKNSAPITRPIGWLIVRTRYPHVFYVTITWYLAIPLCPPQPPSLPRPVRRLRIAVNRHTYCEAPGKMSVYIFGSSALVTLTRTFLLSGH
jgi:hypothetical protein